MIVFFFLGIIYAGIINAGKNQGLAAAAIVLGYGVSSAFMAFFVSLFAAYKLSGKTIVNINKFLGIIIIGFFTYFTWNYYSRIKPKRDQQQRESPTKPKPATSTAKPTTILFQHTSKPQTNMMGLGMFAPNMFDNKALYFYGRLNLEKSILEHSPTDSITFKPSQYGGFDIATAPPYLVPQHLKLDYGILFFKVVSNYG